MNESIIIAEFLYEAATTIDAMDMIRSNEQIGDFVEADWDKNQPIVYDAACAAREILYNLADKYENRI